MSSNSSLCFCASREKVKSNSKSVAFLVKRTCLRSVRKLGERQNRRAGSTFISSCPCFEGAELNSPCGLERAYVCIRPTPQFRRTAAPMRLVDGRLSDGGQRPKMFGSRYVPPPPARPPAFVLLLFYGAGFAVSSKCMRPRRILTLKKRARRLAAAVASVVSSVGRLQRHRALLSTQ